MTQDPLSSITDAIVVLMVPLSRLQLSKVNLASQSGNLPHGASGVNQKSVMSPR
jgi:hypothetical protein